MSGSKFEENQALIADALMAKMTSLESAIEIIFEMTLNVNKTDTLAVIRAVHQITRKQLVGAPIAKVRCQPNCQKYHTRAEAAEILGLHPRSVYEMEGKGLKVSRKSGDPRYLHTWIDEFMTHRADGA